MRTALLTMTLLVVLCFGLVTWLQPRHQARLEKLEPGGGELASLLGDGRQMAADYFRTEADVYFHSGYYPSMFDQARKQEESDADVMHPEEGGNGQEEKGFMGEPLDWIDRFSRHFLPSRHFHLPGEQVREILPWLKLSAELDPHNIRTYLITDYYLRTGLKQSQEAEDFIRDGLKNNPRSPDLLFALGQIYLEDRKDYPRAKNLFLAALRTWHERDDSKPEKSDNGGDVKDYFLLEQIFDGLIQTELSAGNLDQALEYMRQLKPTAAAPAVIQKRIDQLEDRIKSQPAGHK